MQLHIHKKYLLLPALVALMLSCNRNVLDVKNLNAVEPKLTWTDPKLANAFLANLYNRVMPNGWPARSAALYGGLPVDEKRGVINSTTIQTTSHPWSGSFEDSYADIRQVNILLKEIESGTLDAATKDKIVGQALFLRAYSYFLMVRVYGGVPLLLEPQNLTDSLKVPRASTAEVFNAINTDLDKSIQLLQGQPFVDGDKGRIGLGAVLALKGRVALYKASPLFNPAHPYDNAYWQDAYNANVTAKTQLDAMGFGLNADYAGIWSTGNEGNKEAVLTVKFTAPTKTDGRNEQAARPLSQTANATGADNAVWSMVKAYTMKDGYPAGSSPNYAYSDQTFWQNRDPRFNASIVWNGSIYETGGIAGRRQYTDDILATATDSYSPNPSTSNWSFTGLYARKGLQPELKAAEVAQNSVDWIEIRYAEVLLNLAEAANETGHTADAIALLRQLRQRAGIEAGADNSYGITTSNRDAVRGLIYNERFVEFIFEGQRFWDLKRARTLLSLNGTAQQGVASTLKPSNLPVNDAKKNAYGYVSEDFNYTINTLYRTTVDNVTFTLTDNIYFAPIPLAQIQKNPNLKQTLGWGDGTFNPTLE